MSSSVIPADPFALQPLLLDLFQQALGARVDLIRFDITHQLDDYLVLLAQLRHPDVDVIVKLAGPNAALPCPFDRTAALHRLVAVRTTLRMPEVLAVDVSCRVFPCRYFVKRYIPGEEWARAREQMDAEELADAYRQIGRAVAQLHSIRFPAFGELAQDASLAAATPFFPALQDRARAMIPNERARDFFLAILRRREDLFAAIQDASLCHEDLHKHNIIFLREMSQWRLATILDYDKAWAGHSESDLARLEFWRDMSSPDLLASYEEVRPIDPLYRQRRPIYQLLWCLEYARQTPEHIADTRHVCEELGVAFNGFPVQD